MAASRYRRFLKLCEEWPVDETKRGRDLGAYLRQRVAQAFREGENTQIVEPEACDQMYESLARLHSNYYKHKYPRPRDTSFSGLSLEEYKLILSTGMGGAAAAVSDTLDEFKEMNKGTWKKLQEKFAPRSPEGKHTAWARALPRPRT
ncbi:PREDICTED: ubiquinol-cytochrome-c reductase complex assembly factor 2 isoform X1 [Capra hircus]|uniref:ubiquinol-cytochrome-c reductase complex assembly factor 2 isoform X1 n=1 Tax=Capra hircus TaxID=9925 RepID=UPI000846A371|nr:PREDICTED: ubiquinol-cytochrome-c reductase complex assembly factor 2 isoform X1 [Capra hircus]